MIFLRPQGYITSRFGYTEAYRESAHTGIDFVHGYKKHHHALADGFIYKVLGDGNPNPQIYKTVYQLCETPFGPMEIAYTHCYDILVQEGNLVLQGQPILKEGNTGDEVYHGGIKVKKEEKESGKASHLHASVRPVTRETQLRVGEHYLNTASGKPYKDAQGNYYRIKHKDNGTKGWVNFEQWLFTPINQQLVTQLNKVLGYLRHKLM